ncbi:redoxin family protein [Sporosarcina sp. G11-34]|uniref:redoxin family protein n=1 Tax=Sporosarcina sp. G11-34 TaxID=2849605 RepID=UPI0022A9B68A|nr:redoxin family protein [Sporosarcina sp. G11-34]MCZ2257742.1 redoxin domain-containing protein [Sporosarcina sp. G11-34]
MKRKWIVLLIGLLTVAFVSACGKTDIVNTGEQAPMFDLKDLAGNQVALSDFEGEKVYVKYWASWCSICLAGLDELNTLAAQDNDFKVLSIVSPRYKAEKSSAEFKKWFAYLDADNLTVLLDEDGVYSKQFGLLAYPTSYYIGSDGHLVQTIIGHNPNEQIIKTFKDIN